MGGSAPTGLQGKGPQKENSKEKTEKEAPVVPAPSFLEFAQGLRVQSIPQATARLIQGARAPSRTKSTGSSRSSSSTSRRVGVEEEAAAAAAAAAGGGGQGRGRGRGRERGRGGEGVPDRNAQQKLAKVGVFVI